jgi:ribosomal protein S18 acetylase RimI-like enzyme
MLTVRLAEPADVERLRQLAKSAFAPYVARIGKQPGPVSADYAGAVDRGEAWVAEQAGAVVGLLVLVPQPDHLLLDIIAVDPAARGSGVGARLLALAEEQAASRGRPEIRLCTNVAMTENLAYYPRHGYVETHRGRQDGYDRVFFRKRLGQLS